MKSKQPALQKALGKQVFHRKQAGFQIGNRLHGFQNSAHKDLPAVGRVGNCNLFMIAAQDHRMFAGDLAMPQGSH